MIHQLRSTFASAEPRPPTQNILWQTQTRQRKWISQKNKLFPTPFYQAFTSKFSYARVSMRCFFDVERVYAHLRKVRRHDRPVREFPPSKCFQGIRRRFYRVELDEDLAHASWLSAATGWAWDLHVYYLAVLRALIAHIIANFWIH